MRSARLVSIQVGRPRTVGGQDDPGNPGTRPWRTGFHKAQVQGPVYVGSEQIEGDGQGNRRVHGGPDKAVLMYAADHYVHWRSELQLPDFPYGAFAENLTVEGLDEDTVCIGDVFGIGDEVRLQVSQPRQPCANISRRWGLPGLTRQVEETGRTGWYLRVLREGSIEAGQAVSLLERPHPEWSVTRAARTMAQRAKNPTELARLRGVPALSIAWRGR